MAMKNFVFERENTCRSNQPNLHKLGTRREKKRRGVKAISDWLEGGANFFIKKFRGGQRFDREVYFKTGPLAKMGKAVK